MSRASWWLLLVLFPVGAAVGAAGDVPALAVLKNAEYQVSLGSHTVRLTDGVFQAGSSPGDFLHVALHRAALGDLNGDGIEDAAVILVQTTMGSGTFYDLAILTMEKGGFQQRGAVLLGDRIRVRSLRVTSGAVEVAMIAHGAADPACCPTRRITKRYRLQDGVIVEQSRTK